MNYSDDQIIAFFEKSSPDIQDALSSQEFLDLLSDLQKEHGLHVDIVGKIATLIRNLLLGIINPTDFYNELLAAGLAVDVATRIISSTNEKIFIPLRKRMQDKGSAPTFLPVAANTVMKPVAQKPLVPVPAPLPIPQSRPVAPQQAWTPPPVEQTPHVQAPTATVYATHNQWPGAPAGNWQPAAAVHVYVPGPAPVHMNPVQQAQPPVQTAPVYHPAPQTVQVPTPPQPVLPPVIAMPIPVSARPTAPPPPNLPGAPKEAIEKAYVADPYHEPI